MKSLGVATAAVFDLRTAQELFGKDGRYDSILAVGKDGTPAADVRKAVAAAVGSDATVMTAKEQDRFTLDGLKMFISIITIVLIVFGFVAVLVGAFTIFNTLSITVAQRSREFGLLRMVGAARRQVLASVLIEALVDRRARLADRPRAPASASPRAWTPCSPRCRSTCPRRAWCSPPAR